MLTGQEEDRGSQDASCSTSAGDPGWGGGCENAAQAAATCLQHPQTGLGGWLPGVVSLECKPGGLNTIVQRGKEWGRDQKKAVLRLEALRTKDKGWVGVSSLLLFAFLIWGLCVLYSERLKNLIIPKHLY